LAELLTTLELEADRPQTSRCGSCRLCLDVCPTGAIVAPYELDATRCISYLTIEFKREFSLSQQTGVDNWLFGCDVCQEVCPYNAPPTISDEPWFRTGAGPWQDAEQTASLRTDDDMAPLAGTPLTRPKRAGLTRNARAVLANRRIQTPLDGRLPSEQAAEDGERDGEAGAWEHRRTN
jgi:epoxyqueuosine reductase